MRVSPSRTAMPTLVVAKAVRLPGTSAPAFSSLSMAGAPMISTSVVSPPSSRFCNAPTVPKLRSSLVARRFRKRVRQRPHHVVHRTRAHDLELCHLFPHAAGTDAQFVRQGSSICKTSRTSSAATNSSSRRWRSIRSWRGRPRRPASRRSISPAARSAGSNASPRLTCRCRSWPRSQSTCARSASCRSCSTPAAAGATRCTSIAPSRWRRPRALPPSRSRTSCYRGG